MYKFSKLMPAVLLVILTSAQAFGDSLKEGMSWQDVESKGHSLVFGRFEGQFDGPEFRDRSIELRRADNGKKHEIDVDEGLGYFETLLPPGAYMVTAIEATYSPPGRNVNPARYRPIRQRYGVRPKSNESATLPAFYVPPNRPVYVGTVRVDNEPDGIVYRGHYIRIVDEYDEAFKRLQNSYPVMTASLSQLDITPGRHFMLKAQLPESPLELAELEDPITRAREYIGERKFQQAINWLQTFMPASDNERNQVQLLVGEALLGDGKYPESIGKLGDALEADPDNLRALRLLARAHMYNEDREDALNLYEALGEALPGDAEAHLQLGYLYALRSEATRSDKEFDSAFEYDFDYLLHDVAPFAYALRAVRVESLEYEPPRVVRQRVKPPPSIQSRRGGQSGGVALVIDHKGKVVAAQVAPGTSGTMPAMMLAMIRATFKPASLNGVPVPSLLFMGGSGPGAGR